MKRMMKTLAIIAAAAMGLTACQNNFEEFGNTTEIKNSVVVNFVSEEARTSVDTSGELPLFAWGENETFALLEQTDALAQATSVTYEKVNGKAVISAEFAVNEGKDEYQYVAVYPKSGYVATENISAATLALPANQVMAEASYDPNADLMVSLPVTTSAQPTETQSLRFTRLAAVAKMTLKNLALETGEEVESVEFTANGKALAGSINADLSNPHEFTVSKGVSSVEVATSSTGDVYFTVLPTDLAAGDSYSVAVATNKRVYIKQGSIPEGKSLVFDAGMVTRFGVNMSGVVPSEKWKLVSDASTLQQGDIVTIVAKDYDKALSTKLYSNASETSTSAKRDDAEVTKYGNYLVGGSDLQQLILVTGTVDNTFSFYDKARNKFLVSTTTGSTYLINQVYCDVNTSFAIAIDSATAVATISNTEGSYKGNLLRYNTNGYFVSNQNTSSVYKDVCIYRLEGAVGEIPVVAAVVTVPDSDEQVVIAEEGAQSATAIEEVVFNYVGDWTISVSDNAEWLTLSYANGVLSYTAEANTGSVREAVATITASMEGQESLTWSFNLLQKGAPQEVTIEEFITKAVDVNVTYKLTGILTEIPSSGSASAAFKISDQSDNTATIKYLYTDGGDLVKGNVDLKLGDVITLTTVVASSKGQGGSSSYPSIYKGHYRLTASAGVAVEYTGGTVNIAVNTSSNGNVVVPTAVEAAMEECDYATFSYAGGNSATVTFTSENTTSSARKATVTFTYGLASASVTVQQGVNPANKIGWQLVTDASTLAVGDEVIIVAKNADKALAKPTSTVTSLSNFPVADIEKTGSVIYDIEDAGTQIFTLAPGNSDNTFAFVFTYDNTDYHLHAPSSGLKGRLASSGANDGTSWSIAISATDGDATIKNAQPKVVKYNASTGTAFLSYSPTVANATKSDYAVCIYKKETK